MIKYSLIFQQSTFQAWNLTRNIWLRPSQAVHVLAHSFLAHFSRSPGHHCWPFGLVGSPIISGLTLKSTSVSVILWPTAEYNGLKPQINLNNCGWKRKPIPFHLRRESKDDKVLRVFFFSSPFLFFKRSMLTSQSTLFFRRHKIKQSVALKKTNLRQLRRLSLRLLLIGDCLWKPGLCQCV